MSQRPDPFDPAEFAALWSRVAPEGSSCPVAPNAPAARPPAPPGREEAFLAQRVRMELCRWRRFQTLTRWGVPCRALSQDAYNRAKRLSAALFLQTGGRYFPARSLTCPVRESAAACLRTLYTESCRQEARYRETAKGTAHSRLRELYQAMADGHRREQAAICVLLERL